MFLVVGWRGGVRAMTLVGVCGRSRTLAPVSRSVERYKGVDR